MGTYESEVMRILRWGIALGMLIAAAFCDEESGRVPNELIAMGMTTGGYLCWIGEVQRNWIQMIISFLWPIGLLYLLFLIGALGAGDIKLFGCLSLFLEAKDIMLIIVMALFLGASVGAARFLKSKELLNRCREALAYVLTCVKTGKIEAYRPKNMQYVTSGFTKYMFMACLICYMKEVMF